MPAMQSAAPPSDMARPVPLSIWSLLLNMFSLYGEVLLRRGFGERHLRFVSMLLGVAGLLFLPVVLVAVLTFLMSSFMLGTLGGLFAAAMTSQLPWTRGTVFFHLFTLLFIGRCILHFIEMDYRRKAGERVLSTYSGQPNPLWKLVPGHLTEDVIKRYGEPLLMVVLGLWVRQADLLLTCYCVGSGAAMFLKGHWEHQLVVNRIHNIDDQMIEAQALGGHVRGPSRQPGDLKGVALPAYLDQRPAHEARALTSVLQSQSPLAPLPGPLSSPSADQEPAAITAGLPSEFANLIDSVPTLPAPEPPPPVPLEEWVFAEETTEHEEWFTGDADLGTEASEPHPVASQDELRPLVKCTACGRRNRTKSPRPGVRFRCGQCKEPLGARVPLSLTSAR